MRKFAPHITQRNFLGKQWRVVVVPEIRMSQRRQNLLTTNLLKRCSTFKYTSIIHLMIIPGPFDSLVPRTLIARLLYVLLIRCMILIADRISQGKLEHCRPKGWHSQTDRKNFVKQMTQIERRQTRICRIKHKLMSTRAPVEVVATAPEAHHHIGTSQKRHEHIPSFVCDHEGDPAVQVMVLFT